MPLYTPDERSEVRAAARRFEEALHAGKRKRLGQFFTGVPLGKLLAHLALGPDTRAVLDPMAGHGDLIDATSEAADECGIALERLAGIEIDDETAQFCRERLRNAGVQHSIVCASAFDSAAMEQLPQRSYDLAITNPPYVRYQVRGGNGAKGDQVRSGLEQIIGQHLKGMEKAVWSALAKGYSGFADLSVPSWLLAGLMVRPGGRLAIVAPATWRSRDYGDVIRYFLLRCFELEYIIEDKQPGWFSDALVRTHLIIARRLSPQAIAQPLEKRTSWTSASWISISPDAADARSVVGAAFTGTVPEGEFAQWLRAGPTGKQHGIQVRPFALDEEWFSLNVKAARRSWCRSLECNAGDLPLFSGGRSLSSIRIPEAVRDIIGGAQLSSLSTLEDSGIRVGQGLRTGCNRFFYVDVAGPASGNMVRVRASSLYQCHEFLVPTSALRPVLRKQTELPQFERGSIPGGRVLNLRQWVLPEDAESVVRAMATYRQCGETPPQIMPDALAAYVRLAAEMPIDDTVGGKYAPELSAVRTNVRVHSSGAASPRFWYMLPDFMPRHLPAAFVARVVSDVPRVECNLEESILIDANFSTFWTAQGWSRFSLKALLNSGWCQLLMEALGTPLGGGALKLEAAHLRQLPVPALSEAARRELDEAGRTLARDATGVLAKIDAVVFEAAFGKSQVSGKASLAHALEERAERLRRMRLRTAA